MQFLFLLSLSGLALLNVVDAHGHLTLPSSRNGGKLSLGGSCTDGACFWFTNNVEITGPPTLAPSDRTLQLNVTMGSTADIYKTSPWRKPGTAKVFGRGCGAAGGGPVAYANGGVAPQGIKQGMDGVDLPELEHESAPKWAAGSVQEVAFAISANHGGGYSWRICKNDENVSEECFQQNTLKFHGDVSYVAYPDGSRKPFKTLKVTNGVYPEGSDWAKDPIPGCYVCDAAASCGQPIPPVPASAGGGKNETCWEECFSDEKSALEKAGCSFPLAKSEPKACWTAIQKICGHCSSGGGDSKWDAQVNCYAMCDGAGASKPTGSCPENTAQFPEVVDGISGFGKSVWEWSILDKVEIPEGLEKGKYLLSWRWDCEESTQVWQNCADVEIV